MGRSFSLCILFGDKPHLRPPEQIGPGWDMTEIPVALQVLPFASEATWATKKAEIASSNLAPIRVSSRFLQFWRLELLGRDVDEGQLQFWTRRAVRRLAELGLGTVRIYAGLYERLFRPVRNMGYAGAVSCACAWVSTDRGDLDF